MSSNLFPACNYYMPIFDLAIILYRPSSWTSTKIVTLQSVHQLDLSFSERRSAEPLDHAATPFLEEDDGVSYLLVLTDSSKSYIPGKKGAAVTDTLFTFTRSSLLNLGGT